MIDQFFGVNIRSRAVLAMLTDFLEFRTDLRIKTFAWYNGRENWCGIEVQKNSFTGNVLYLVFGEHRNSDDLTYQHMFKTRAFVNPPNVSDFPEVSYQARRYFPGSDYNKIVRSIEDLINNHYGVKFDTF